MRNVVLLRLLREERLLLSLEELRHATSHLRAETVGPCLGLVTHSSLSLHVDDRHAVQEEPRERNPTCRLSMLSQVPSVDLLKTISNMYARSHGSLPIALA